MALPPTVHDLLALAVDTTESCVRVEHIRRRRFRWLGILEAVGAVLLCACIVPLALVLAVVGEDNSFNHVDVFPIQPRFFHYHHDIAIRLDAEPLAPSEVYTPDDEDDGNAFVVNVLDAARALGLTVVEGVVAPTFLPGAVWHTRHPLLAARSPASRHPLEERLSHAGFSVSRAVPGSVVLSRDLPRTPRLMALLCLTLVLPLTVVLFWSESWRRLLSTLLDDSRERPPARQELLVQSTEVHLQTVRGARTWDVLHLDRTDLLGISYAPSLGYDRNVTVRAPALRWVARGATRSLPLRLTQETGPLVRDWLIACLLHPHPA
jgi:hypothetical protein